MKSIVVVGLQPLGLSIIRRLASTGKPLISIGPAPDLSACREELDALGVQSVVASPASAPSILGQVVDSATVMILTDDQDGANVDLALRIRRLRKDLPLVVRIFDHTLSDYLRSTMSHVTVFSIAGLAAPAFVNLALKALAERAPLALPARSQSWLTSKVSLPSVDRVLVAALACHLLLIIGATFYFSNTLGLPLIDALYFVSTTVTTVGYGDISVRHASATAKIFDMFLMFAGAAFVAVLFALFTGWVVGQRLDVLHGLVRVRREGHVIVVGAGNVGFRVATQLTDNDRRVVVIDRDAGRNTAALRADGHHVILADGASEATLRLAGLPRAAVLLALTDSDATNLEIVLKARRLASTVPVIARFASPELSWHTSDHGHAVTASSVAIASEQIAEIASKLSAAD